jgi:hypothetical protein
MAGMRPTVRSLLVCESILQDKLNPNRVSLIHLINSIRPSSVPSYPVRHPQLSVFAHLTECRGTAHCRIVVRDGDTDQPVFGSSERNLNFPNAPLILNGIRFRLLDCPFPHPGLYWVQLWYDTDMLAQTPLVLL